MWRAEGVQESIRCDDQRIQTVEGGEIVLGDRRRDAEIAYGLLRFVFGVNICFHGVSRLLGDHQAFVAYLTKSMASAVLIPKSAIPVFAAVLPWVEALVGLLLMLGLYTRLALIAGFLVMILLMAGITLAQEWNTAGVQLIYCIIYFILLSWIDRNYFSLDTLLRRPDSKSSA
jgi:thiosulfate dehydrogenase [quinone] large subunit